MIPPPSDSTRIAFSNRSRAAWEWALIVPYSVIYYPLHYLRLGTGAGVRWVDRAGLFKYLHLVPVPKGFVPSFGYSDQEGALFGLGYFNQVGPRNPIFVRGEYSTERWSRVTAGSIINRSGRYEFQVGVGFRERPNLEFFGIGPNTNEEDFSFYREKRRWLGAGARRRFAGSSLLAFLVTYSAVETGLPAEGNEPSVPERFPGFVQRPGFDKDSEGVMVRFAYVLDTTRRQGNPSRGTIVGGSVGMFGSSSRGEESFLAYRFEFQQFLPLWHSGRALALRTYINWLKNTGELAIPFQRLFINEMPDQFRGYDKGRWRDRGITGLTLEYRFPFLADSKDGGFGMDTVLLTDIGQVFHKFQGSRGISTDNLTHSYGFGFRMYAGEYFSGALEFVWADEGLQFRIATRQLFQFSRDVLYRGKEETLIH